MVWVYNRPLSKNEGIIQSFLEKTFKKRSYSEKIIKLLSLTNYLKSKKFKSAESLRKDVLLKEGTPLFDENNARRIFKSLSKKTGGSATGEYPYTETVIRGMASYLKSKDPIGIAWIFEDGLWLAKIPTETLKTIIGPKLYDFISVSLHAGVETGVSGVNGVAADAAGPIGLAVVILFTAIAAAAGATLSISEGVFAQAVIHFINLIPGPGPAIVKGINKIEHLAKKVEDDREIVEAIPFIGETISWAVPSGFEKVYEEEDSSEKDPQTEEAGRSEKDPQNEQGESDKPTDGGKRFSTRRRIRAKCPRTRRQRFARR